VKKVQQLLRLLAAPGVCDGAIYRGMEFCLFCELVLIYTVLAAWLRHSKSHPVKQAAGKHDVLTGCEETSTVVLLARFHCEVPVHNYKGQQNESLYRIITHYCQLNN